MTARRKHEDVAEHLETLICSSQLRPGDRIPSERDLMTRYGIGRSGVREALSVLQRKGMLALRAGARARVTEPSPDALIDGFSGAARLFVGRPDGVRALQQARALFEIGLARRAATVADAADVARLEGALEANRRARDQRAFERTDLAFHHALAEIGGNPIFASLNAAFDEWLVEQRSVSARSGVGFETVVAEHEAVCRAVAARDREAAQDAMEAHLDAVAERYWRALEGRDA